MCRVGGARRMRLRMNARTLSLSARWKSSRISAVSCSDRDSRLTSADSAVRSGMFSRARSAAIAATRYSAKRCTSDSSSSRVSQATRVPRSSSRRCHCTSRLVLPYPAGAWTNVRRRLMTASSQAGWLARATCWAARAEGAILVRIGSPGLLLLDAMAATDSIGIILPRTGITHPTPPTAHRGGRLTRYRRLTARPSQYAARMRLGIDVGGTNTDAVLVAGRTVVASAKRPTTADVSGGIVAATREVLAAAGEKAPVIDSVMIGTTHFANAFVERKGLLEVAILRLAGASGESLPPMSGWPDDVKRSIGALSFQLPGGYEFDGRENTAFDERAVRSAARQIRRDHVDAVAISCVFAPINRSMEERAARIVAEEAPGVSVTISSAMGRIGFLERENATIMNAALARMASHVIQSFHRAFAKWASTRPCTSPRTTAR